eukprot:GABV01000382.1.p1 GENE.GABV01000382.1~~GABV01000382.1.p1  ORF type:complete len:435 (-),score=145.32 GABV01000382.1:67-1338(-)
MHYRLLVAGAGPGGLSVASAFSRRFARSKGGSVAIVDPASKHWYQPGFTLVGAGKYKIEDQWKPMSKVIPEGAQHYPTAVAEFDPDNNAVTLNDGQKLTYDFLVVALGLQTKLDAFPGLREALDDPDSPVTTNYLPEYVTKTFPLIQGLKKGNAVFTFPQTVVKCAGAPQKVMWLAESQWRKNGVRQDIDISFYTPTPAIFSAPKYAASLMKQAQARNVNVNLKHAMKKLDAKRRVVTIEELESKKTFEKPYDFLHVVPPFFAPDVLAKSPLANEAGFCSVDPTTLQHTKYSNVFSLGDASSLPTSKTAAALAAQSGVLKSNLAAVMDGKPMQRGYTGYTSCPLFIGDDQLILAEFDYKFNPQESFWLDQGQPSNLMFHLTKDVMGRMYWNSLLTGHWNGPRKASHSHQPHGQWRWWAVKEME